MDRAKGFVWFVVLVIAIVFTTGVAVAADKKEGKKPQEKQAQVKEATEKTEKGVIYKFKSQEEIQEFANIYNAKMAITGRMAVLQAYFAMEQQNMQTVNGQIKEKLGFEFDPNKQYELNTDELEIREIEAIVTP